MKSPRNLVQVLVKKQKTQKKCKYLVVVWCCTDRQYDCTRSDWTAVMHDACVCDIHIVLLIRWDKVQSLQADQVTNLGMLQAATQAAEMSTLGTFSTSSALTPDHAPDQVSASQTAQATPAQASQVLVSQAAADQTAHVCLQISQTATPQTAHMLNVQAGAPPQCNVLTPLTTVQVCTVQVAQGTVQTTQGSNLNTAQGTSLDTAKGTSLDTAQGIALDTAQVCPLDTAQGIALDTAQVCPLDTAQGTALDTAQVGILNTAGQASVYTPDESTYETGDE